MKNAEWCDQRGTDEPAATTECVDIPRAPKRAVAGTFGLSGMGHRGETILLVEDEDFVAEVTSQVLQAAGYRVLRARNASEAMILFREHADEVQLLLTDVIMPGKTGADLAEEVQGICPRLRVIFMSGYPEVPDREVAPGVFFLAKPFSVHSLTQTVWQALEQTVANSGGEHLARAAGDR